LVSRNPFGVVGGDGNEDGTCPVPFIRDMPDPPINLALRGISGGKCRRPAALGWKNEFRGKGSVFVGNNRREGASRTVSSRFPDSCLSICIVGNGDMDVRIDTTPVEMVPREDGRVVRRHRAVG
jgi:hypothetical protein